MWSLFIGTIYGCFTRNGSSLYENSMSVVHDDIGPETLWQWS